VRLIVDGSRGFECEIEAIASRGSDVPPEVETAVRGIIDAVRREGDAAVARCARRFDRCGLPPSKWKVTRRAIDGAFRGSTRSLDAFDGRKSNRRIPRAPAREELVRHR
jgi:histidinol dehydrogenase